MHGNAQALAVADLLTDADLVAHLHQGRAGGADVLAHGDHHGVRLQCRGGACFTQFFAGRRMYAAGKQVFHQFRLVC